MISKHRKYIFLQLVIVVLVILSFRLIPEKRMASLVATSLFLLGAGFVLLMEAKTSQGRKGLSFLSTLIFVLFFVVPIIVLRIKSWDGVFELESLFGITGGQLHRGSNVAFMVMLSCYFFESLKEARLKASLKAEKPDSN
jgi:hypothetical protein